MPIVDAVAWAYPGKTLIVRPCAEGNTLLLGDAIRVPVCFLPRQSGTSPDCLQRLPVRPGAGSVLRDVLLFVLLSPFFLVFDFWIPRSYQLCGVYGN